jgi:hypothetical protein
MMSSRILPGLLLLLIAPGFVRAEGDGQARAEAKERFARGLHLFENGDNGGALAEFKRAYDLVPNRLVLYNISLVYSAMGKPVEAVQSLEQVLSDPGPLKPEYLERARTTKDEQERRIGTLEVQVNVPAAVEVDGVKAGEAPLTQPLRVAAGEHVVGAMASGYLPVRQTTTVAGSARASLAFTLQPTEARLAHLDIRCPVPGAEVLVDGAPVGKTPMAASVAVPPGTRVIEIRRPGYATARRELNLNDGARGEMTIELDESANEGPRGSLRLTAIEGDVFVSIDGRTRGVYRQSLTLPAGPHVVKLERAGFESLERVTEVPSGGETTLKVGLRPTVEAREAYGSRARAYRHWAYAALISGVAIAGGSTGLALWSQSKYTSAQSHLTQTRQEATWNGGGQCDGSYGYSPPRMSETDCAAAMTNALDDVDRYRNLRTAGIIGAVGGAALIGTGVALWLLGPDPDRYEKGDALASRLIPVLVASPNSASLSLQGRF